MDTGKNELSPEMMEKIYKAYKLNQKEEYDKFNEGVKKIISNEEYPEAGDVLKLVEGDVITDNHNRRLVDPSLFKLRGKPLSFFDEPYPVMMPEDIKMMKVMSDEIVTKLREYLEPKKLITGCTQNFKPYQKLDMVEAVFNTLDADKPDRNGRIWERDLLARQMMGEQIYLITPRQRKSWMWLKFLQSQSYEIQHRPIVIPPSKKLDLYSVIHMRWPKPDLSKVRLEKPRNILFPCNYLREIFGPIDSFRTDLLSDYAAEMIEKRTSQNLNDEKKQLTRIIKKARKHK